MKKIDSLAWCLFRFALKVQILLAVTLFLLQMTAHIKNSTFEFQKNMFQRAHAKFFDCKLKFNHSQTSKLEIY